MWHSSGGMSDTFAIGGGDEAQVVVESTHDTFDSAKFSNWLANGAGLGIYAHGRVHQQVGRLIYVGDMIHKRGHASTEDVLLMEEQCTLAHSDPLSAPSRLGRITAMAVLPTMSTANGEGDLIAYYENGVVSFNTFESPRETRIDGKGANVQKGWDTKRLVNHLLNRVSATGRYAVASLTRDHFFRSRFGLHFLKTVLGEGSFNTEQTNRISQDVDPILDKDLPVLLRGAAAGHWLEGNRMMATTGLAAGSHTATAAGRGMVVWNQASTFTEDRTPSPVWEGLWTFDNGIEGVHWLGDSTVVSQPGSFGALVSDRDGKLYFASVNRDALKDFRDGVHLPIEWSFETGRFAFDGLATLKTVREGRLEGVFGEASQRVRVLIRTDLNTAWKVWKEFAPCDKVKMANQSYLLSEPLGQPPAACREATWFQIRVEGLGAAEIRVIDLDFSPGTVKSGRHQCSVIGAPERDFFEINSSPAADRWTSSSA